MVALNKIQVQWSGTTGLPGVSTFYEDSGTVPDLAKLKTFFEALKASIPNVITIKYPSSGLSIDSVTGAAIGSWSLTPPADTVCTAAGAYSAAAGAVVNWKSGQYVGGRQLRGKTFIVPLGSICYGGTGQMQAATVTAFQTAANTLLGTWTGMRVWSKKNGAVAPVTSASVPSITAVLRSRRD